MYMNLKTNKMMVTLISLVVSIIVLAYVVFITPKRLKEISNKCDIIAKNQGIIERKIKDGTHKK